MTSLPATDKEGFLRNLDDWTVEVAGLLAAADGIELTDDHWQIIDLVRDYYASYRVSPVMRVLVRIVREALGAEKGNSIYLMRLFRGRPARFVNKIAGLPRPTNCD